MGAFLDFLQRTMIAHPERLVGLTPDLIERARALTSDMAADLDAPISGDVAI
jgi:hypothetical protein